MGWVTAGQFFNVLLSFVIIKQISSIGTEGYGIYALIVSAMQLSGHLLYGPGVQSFLRFYYHFYDKGSSRSLVSVIYKFILYSGGAILLVGLIAAGANEIIDLSLTWLIITLWAVYTISYKTNEFFSMSLNMLRRRKRNTIFLISEKLVNILLLWTAHKYFTFDVTTVVIILIFTSLTFSVMKYLIFTRLAINKIESPFPNKHTRDEVKRTLIKYAVPFVLWGLAGWIQLHSEKWILANFLTTSDVGIYALMMSLVSGLIIIPGTIINDFSTPIIYQCFSDLNDKEKLKRGHFYINLMIYVVVALSIFASIITALFGKEMLYLISSESFTAFWYLLPLLCLGKGLFQITLAMSNIALAMNLPQRYVVPKILTGIIAIALNTIFVIYYGIAGIAYSSIAINVFGILYIWIINKKIMTEFKLT